LHHSFVIVMSELFVAILLIVTGFLFSIELRRRLLAEMRLTKTLASVEQQVADRTAALSKAMAELKRSEQLKDEFLATASHELRTPLNAIVGWVHVLQTGTLAGDDERRHAIDAIDRNARIQTRLIEDLLDVSRMTTGIANLAVAPMDLRSSVGSAIETLRPAAAAKDISLEVENTNDALLVLGDEQRLQQVLWNLVANALKYTPRGGRVKITSSSDGERAVVTVADNGEGIDPAFLPHVFEPFRQGASLTMRSGLGLGLAIVRRLVDLHGGQITAESSGAGCGATFTLSLPLAHGAKVAA
jgi:signal transduction histidine kinase